MSAAPTAQRAARPSGRASRNTGKTSVANFSIATSETFKDSEGKQQKSTEWHNVASFRSLADIVGKYLKNGSKVYVEGRLKTRKWEDREGVTRYTTEVIATKVKFLDAKRADAEQESAAAYKVRHDVSSGPSRWRLSCSTLRCPRAAPRSVRRARALRRRFRRATSTGRLLLWNPRLAFIPPRSRK